MLYTLSDFTINDQVLLDHKDLVDLIISSETISDKDQKQYWIDSLEDMWEDQISSLRWILWDEKEWLQKISEDFNEDLAKENAEKNEKERLERKRKREKEEEVSEEKDNELEIDLLAELDDL